MELVCFQGKDNVSQINALIKKGDWDKVLVVRHKDSDDFKFEGECEVLKVDCDKPLQELKEEITDKLKERLGKDFEVALSIASGTGKEHMALISALLSVPVGVKLTAFTKKGVEFVN